VRIRDDVCALLSDDPWVDASDVEVVVHQREVSLIGTVTDFGQRARAVRLAESVRGVIDVVSRIRVRRGDTPDAHHRR
jgi:osmotically-inducible protein OsmY